MGLPTVNDVQAIDPILQNLLVGYKQADDRFVAGKVFPLVNVPNKSGTYYIFTKKYWFTNEMQLRAPGTKYARSEFGVETSTYTTLQYALSYAIADETRRASLIPMELESVAARWLAQKSLLNKEIQFAADWMITGVWGTTSSGNTTGTGTAFYKWNYSTSDPISDVMTAKRTISNNTGVDPNTMVMGYLPFARLLNHPDILDRIKYTTAALQNNIEAALGALFGCPNFWVAKGTYSNTNESDDFTATAIIDDDCLVTYVSPNPGLFEPSSGYTFAWDGGGGLGAVQPVWRDGEADADVIKLKEQWDQKGVAIDLGYMMLDIVD